MRDNANSSPMLRAAGLWAKTSVKGGQYLTGRLGGVKVLVLENRERQGDDDSSHHLFFVEAPDHLVRGQERDEGPRGGKGPPTRQRPSQPHCSGVQGHAGGDHDDIAPWER